MLGCDTGFVGETTPGGRSKVRGAAITDRSVNSNSVRRDRLSPRLPLPSTQIHGSVLADVRDQL